MLVIVNHMGHSELACPPKAWFQNLIFEILGTQYEVSDKESFGQDDDILLNIFKIKQTRK